MRNLKTVLVVGSLDGSKVRTDKANYIYCHDIDVTEEFIVWSDKGPDARGSYVIVDVDRATGELYVLSVIMSTNVQAPAVMNHARQNHAMYGTDPVTIITRQVINMCGYLDSANAKIVIMPGFPHNQDGTISYFPGGEVTIDSIRPSSGARWAHIVVNPTTLEVETVLGDIVPTKDDLVVENIPVCPRGKYPSTAVRVTIAGDVYDNRTIQDVYDTRKIFVMSGDETGTEAAWGSISGTLSDQTDLQEVLNGKPDFSEDEDVLQGMLNGEWANVPEQTDPDWDDVQSKPSAITEIAALTPSEDDIMQFDGANWVSVPVPESGIPEAPINGLLHGRKDGAWEEFVAGGGGEGLIEDDLTSQIDGVMDTFALSDDLPIVHLFHNGVRQIGNFSKDIYGSLVLDFDEVPQLGHTLVAILGAEGSLISGGGGSGETDVLMVQVFT
jgi:hypothetical protein